MDKKLFTKFAVLALAVVFMAGCATTGKKGAKKPQAEVQQELENKVTELESTVEKQNQEMELLKSRLEGMENRGGSVSSSGSDMSASTKPSVKQIQKALKSAGLYTGAVDGKLGPKTKAAIREFQSANGLKADGVVGKRTWQKMKQYID